MPQGASRRVQRPCCSSHFFVVQAGFLVRFKGSRKFHRLFCFAKQKKLARGTFLVPVRWWGRQWSLELHRPGRISSRRAKQLKAYIARLLQ